MAPARPAAPRRAHSYLLRVSFERGEPRLLLQDLRSGDRRQFGSHEDLRRFLASLRPGRLR